MAQSLWKTVWQFLAKQSIHLPYNSAITPLGFYSTDPKIYVYAKKLFVKVYTSFITKNWKQPRAPSIGDTPNGVNKLCYGHTMEPDSKIKQRNFQFINECLHNWVLFRNKDERHKSYMHIAKWKSPWKTCCLFLTIWHSRTGKTIETMKRSEASWYLGWGWFESVKNRAFFRLVKPFTMRV